MTVFSFKSTITPKPELTSRPANNAPKDNEPLTNNSVIKMLEAQLGINPTNEANNGAR